MEGVWVASSSPWREPVQDSREIGAPLNTSNLLDSTVSLPGVLSKAYVLSGCCSKFSETSIWIFSAENFQESSNPTFVLVTVFFSKGSKFSTHSI